MVSEVALSLKVLATLSAAVWPLHVSMCLQVSVQVTPPLVLNTTPDTLKLPLIGVDFRVGKQAAFCGEIFIALPTPKLCSFLLSFQCFSISNCFLFDITLLLNRGHFITGFMNQSYMCFNSAFFYYLF